MITSLLVIALIVAAGFVFYQKGKNAKNAKQVVRDTCVIVGGSMAGLIAAAFLSQRFRKVCRSFIHSFGVPRSS
jgi:hypothetical protein